MIEREILYWKFANIDDGGFRDPGIRGRDFYFKKVWMWPSSQNFRSANDKYFTVN